MKTSNQSGQQHSEGQNVACQLPVVEEVQPTEAEVESILPHKEDDLEIQKEATNAEDLSNSREKSLSPVPVVSSVITSVIRMTPHPPELQTLSTQNSAVNSEATKDMSVEHSGDSKDDNQQNCILEENIVEAEPSSSNWNKDFSYENPPPLVSKPLDSEAPPVYQIANSAIKMAPIFNKQPKKLTVKLKTHLPKPEEVANAEVIQKEEVIDEPMQLLVPKIEIKCEPSSSTSTATITSTSSSSNDGSDNSNIDSKMDIELFEDNKAAIKIEKDLSEIVDYAGHNTKVVESNDIRFGEEVFNVKILEADEGEMLIEADEEDNPIVGYKYEVEEYNEEEELECARYAKTMTMPTVTATATSTSSSSGRPNVDENFGKFEIDRKDIFEAGPSRSSKYIDYSDELPNYNYMQPEQIPLAWVQKFSPQYTPFDDQVSYTDLDMCSKNNSNSAGGVSGSNSSHNESIVRATSTDSLNIRTDEQMPAKGEISEQESNGEIELSWNRVRNNT